MSYLDEASAGTPTDVAGQYPVPEAYRRDVEDLFGILSVQLQEVSEELEKCHAEGLEAVAVLNGRIEALEEWRVIAEAETEFPTPPSPTDAGCRLAGLAEEWLRRS